MIWYDMKWHEIGTANKAHAKRALAPPNNILRRRPTLGDFDVANREFVLELHSGFYMEAFVLCLCL